MTFADSSNVEGVSQSGADDDRGPCNAGKFRRYIPQIMACMAMNLMQFGVGLGVGFPTILIPVLTGLQADRYPNETLRFSAEEASWYGSLLFLTEPLGSVCSGWVSEQIGRKRAILLACIPHTVAWILLYTAQSAPQVFAAGILLGFGAGLLIPTATYVGEISQPTIRGPLLNLSTMSTMIGVFTVFMLGTSLTWRDATLVGLAMPLLAAIAIIWVPETPQWLVAKHRVDDARKALQWLRGWTAAKEVEAELGALKEFIALANACEVCQKKGDSAEVAKCQHASSYREKVRDLVRTKTLRPFVLVVFSFFICHSSGNMAIRPFLVQIFATFGIPLDANWGLVVFGLIDILCNVFCVFVIPIFGKRPLFLCGLFAVAVSCFAVGANAFYTFPLDTSSFENTAAIGVGDNYVALVFLITLAMGASVSGCMPWMMNSEIYPFRIRGTATGITSACSYIGIFVATKTYLSVERGLSIGGGFIMYGAITAVGLLVLYQVLPETDGKTLEEIENFFSDKTRKLTDRTIRPIVATTARDAVELAKTKKPLDNPAFVEGV